MSAPESAAVLDHRRLAAVEASGLLGAGRLEGLDRLAELAATLVGAPMAFVTVVDSQRSWYKAGVGLPEAAPTSVDVDGSFCKYVVASGVPLIVDDARSDPMTCDNAAIVTLGVAAWAGYPLCAPDGEVLGAFCVVDTVSHHWTDEDVVLLATLAQAAASEIALRSQLGELEQARRELAAARCELAALRSGSGGAPTEDGTSG
ncbi:MAG: GAF domain-containing protein [Acidimicrobiales bacterium]